MLGIWQPQTDWHIKFEIESSVRQHNQKYRNSCLSANKSIASPSPSESNLKCSEVYRFEMETMRTWNICGGFDGTLAPRSADYDVWAIIVPMSAKSGMRCRSQWIAWDMDVERENVAGHTVSSPGNQQGSSKTGAVSLVSHTHNSFFIKTGKPTESNIKTVRNELIVGYIL